MRADELIATRQVTPAMIGAAHDGLEEAMKDEGVPVATTLEEAAADPALTLDAARELLRDAAAGIRSIAASADKLDAMNLRDYFAAKALTGALSGPCAYPNVFAEHQRAVAELCYSYADAMLVARGAQGGGT